MKRGKPILGAILALAALLIGLPCWLMFSQLQQEHRDQGLIAAIKAKDTPKALELLSEGADGNAHDTGEVVPSFHQALLRLLERLRHPRESSASQPDEEQDTALLIACNDPYQNGTLVQALLDHHARVNDRDEAGNSPLLRAVARGNADIMSVLLERGADIEAQNSDGMAPLMEANTDVEATTILLEHGARIEATDPTSKWTALFYATQGTADVVRLLLKNGANVSHRDKFGRTALDVARDDSEMVALLRQHGAK